MAFLSLTRSGKSFAPAPEFIRGLPPDSFTPSSALGNGQFIAAHFPKHQAQNPVRNGIVRIQFPPFAGTVRLLRRIAGPCKGPSDSDN